MITAIPYGLLADKYGTKLVLWLCIFGRALSVTGTIVVCKSMRVCSGN